MNDMAHLKLVDLELLSRVEMGDQGAIASLYDRHSTLVYSIALRVSGETAIAEEVVQAVFMQIWSAPRQFFLEPKDLNRTLGLISRNLAVGLSRGHQPIMPSDKRYSDCAIIPIDRAQAPQLSKKPRVLASLLPDADRRVLEMALFDGLTPVEISDQTGFPADTIVGRIRKALSHQKNSVDET
jgi:RNA polymerase sigma-70 factor (ECF subfamily)